MATSVSTRHHGGLPKAQHAANPFDSDDDVPATSSTSSRSHVSDSTRYSNPFDDDAPPHGGHTTSSKSVVDHRHVKSSSNPFDDDYVPAKPSKHVGNDHHKVKSGHSNHSSSSRDASNPFDDDYAHEVTSKPTKARGESILDEGSLFDDDEMPAGQAAKERKSSTSSTKAFTARMKESGARIKEGSTRIKETASSSLSSVKLPNFSSSSSASARHGDEKSDSKRGKSKQQSRDLFGSEKQSKDLFGEVQPGYHGYQQNYSSSSQFDESRLAGQTVEELEQYAVSRSQDTTSSIKNAIRIAEDTKGVATTTLETLHDQGGQIRRTHDTAVRVDEELHRGEKLLGTLGGMFTMTWKPKKAHKITGPQVDPEQYRRKNHLGERGALGLTGGEPATRPRTNVSGMSSSQAQLEMEKNTQDDALSDLSNILGQLKGMTAEMGNEIDRQNGDLDRMHDDVHELNARVKGANTRTRHLLGR